MNIQNDSLKTGVMYVIAVCIDIALSCAEHQFFCAINKFPNFAELYELRNLGIFCRIYSIYIGISLSCFNPNDNSFFQNHIGNCWKEPVKTAILLEKLIFISILKFLWSDLWSEAADKWSKCHTFAE